MVRYVTHFIIKVPAKDFKGEFKCLEENAEKHITFSVPIKNDNVEKNKIKWIGSFRFMSSTLSNLVDNLSDTLHSDKCTDCKSYLDYMSIRDDQLIFRCFNAKIL